MRVTVVIPVFRAPPSLPALLAALARQTRPADEVLIVDDGSRVPLAASGVRRACAALPGARLLRHRRNRGLAAARNTGWRAATGDVVAFFDADTIPPPEWLARATALMADPARAGVGGPGRERGGPALADRWRAVFWVQTLGAAPVEPAWMLPGLASAYRQAALTAAGGFDPRFRRAGEDVDLGLRLVAAGARLRFDPALAVAHERHDGLCSLVAMVARHAAGQQRAVDGFAHRGAAPAALRRAAHARSRALLIEAARWLLVSTGSSLRRRRSARLAALSLAANAVQIAARLRAVAGPR